MADSVFSMIARGETDAHVVFETERVMAVLDINPVCEGHTILFPKEPYQVLGQLPADLVGELFEALGKVRHATVLQDARIAGLTSVIAQGTAAGQRAPHLLVHTIPRSSGDGLFPRSEAQLSLEVREQLEPIVRSIALEGSQRVELADPARGRAELIALDASSELFETLEPAAVRSFGSLVARVSAAAFDALGAEGTTILIESGLPQTVPAAEARIVLRWQQDELELGWTPGEATDLRAIADRFARVIGSSAQRSEEPPARDVTREEPSLASEATNYLLEQLNRLP